jgi:RNA polymerase sigma-70 factor (ECF subfamily)
VVGSDRVATLLSRFRTIAPYAVVNTVWLNGAPAGRITRIYAIRNPHKLARLEEEATLSR